MIITHLLVKGAVSGSNPSFLINQALKIGHLWSIWCVVLVSSKKNEAATLVGTPTNHLLRDHPANKLLEAHWHHTVDSLGGQVDLVQVYWGWSIT